MITLRSVLLDAFAVLMPVTCAGCDADDRAICDPCRHELLPVAISSTLSSGTPVNSALSYDGVVRRLILAFKEHGRTDVAAALALPLLAAVTEAVRGVPPGGAVELVGVPASAGSFRRRGYDPVTVLAGRTGLPRPIRLLRTSGDRARQKLLGREGRLVNLEGAFRARASLDGRRLLLIDDVLTTGATLDEAVRALTEAGAEVIGAATLAATPKRIGVSPVLAPDSMGMS